MYFCLVFVLIWSVTASDIAMKIYSNKSLVHNFIGKYKTEEDEIHFLLYDRNDSKLYKEIKINNNESLQQSNLNFKIPSKIIIHGWISNNETSKAIEVLKDALVDKTVCNIIVVDWQKLASGQYKIAFNFSKTVATFLIEFLKFLIANGVSMEQMHLIGHCIGAHIAAIAGKYFRDQNQMIDAITGLDPAYPLYKFCSEDLRLDNEDARHVEVIHSNAGIWGYRSEIGHIDFFPNGGKYQPGCNRDDVCAHDRALVYYAYSIIGTKFLSIAVEFRERPYYLKKKKLDMGGLKLNYGKKGSYWTRTGYSPPFIFDPNDDPY